MNEPRYVDRETVDTLHRISLEAHGGQDGLRNEHGLESALAQARHVFEYGGGDLATIAATYVYHLAENQPFVDGNKRTAVLTALYFLEANRVNTTALPDAELYEAIIGFAAKRFDKPALAALFRRHLTFPR